ncbi:unnamed protein product [Paramecium primaurelia]|uniref:Uncharacterized protein n=1 Tax=Paramecium primaurelia TaxID=5886 RepID=A0A8S1QFL6_PARPR|nr:unnamed protein product [Paramecium primaurelia]
MNQRIRNQTQSQKSDAIFETDIDSQLKRLRLRNSKYVSAVNGIGFQDLLTKISENIPQSVHEEYQETKKEVLKLQSIVFYMKIWVFFRYHQLYLTKRIFLFIELNIRTSQSQKFVLSSNLFYKIYCANTTRSTLRFSNVIVQLIDLLGAFREVNLELVQEIVKQDRGLIIVLYNGIY